MSRLWADLGRLVILILLLPVILIISGPMMVLAVFRGRQNVGPITLNTTRYDLLGRAGILMLGVALWLLVWGGVGWLFLAALMPGTSLTSPTRIAVALPTDPPTAEPAPPEPDQAGVTVSPADTPTSVPAEATATITSPSTPAPAATNTAGRRTPSPTAAPSQTATPAESPTPALTPTPSATRTPAATLTAGQRLGAIRAVETANQVLRAAIIEADEESLAELEAVWQDKALTVIQDFATDLNERYAAPLEVELEYLSAPTVTSQISPTQLFVTSQERWRYGSADGGEDEAFEFIYTLNLRDERWIITSYSFRNLPQATETPASDSDDE